MSSIAEGAKLADEDLGKSKSIFYFETCGQINTRKTLELAIQRARELGIKKLVVASETRDRKSVV